MNPKILASPPDILDCAESTVRSFGIGGIFNRTSTGFFFCVATDLQPSPIVRAEVRPLCLILSSTLQHVAVIDFESCLALAKVMSDRSQLLAVSTDSKTRLFSLTFTLPLGNGACLDDQVVTTLRACLAAIFQLPLLLLRYGRGEIGLERFLICVALPGVGFDEPDPSRPRPVAGPATNPGGNARFENPLPPLE